MSLATIAEELTVKGAAPACTERPRAGPPPVLVGRMVGAPCPLLVAPIATAVGDVLLFVTWSIFDVVPTSEVSLFTVLVTPRLNTPPTPVPASATVGMDTANTVAISRPFRRTSLPEIVRTRTNNGLFIADPPLDVALAAEPSDTCLKRSRFACRPGGVRARSRGFGSGRFSCSFRR